MKSNYSLFAFLILFAFHLNGQELINPATLPEVEAYTVVRTNADADTIILALHGGPTENLYEGDFSHLEEIPTFSVVEIKKQEMLSYVLSNDSLTFEQAVAVNDTTAALIEKVVQFYNDQNKTVVLIGHSWGAIIMGEYMDDYGVDNVHKIIPMEGRLSVPLEFVDYLLDGYLPSFLEDGTIVSNFPQNAWAHGVLTLGASAFSNRWVDSLANMNLSNMMYTYAEYDTQTGALIPEETTFLENAGAQILVIPEGSHGDSFDEENQLSIVEFIRDEFVTDVKEAPTVQQPFKLFPTLASSSIQIETAQLGTLSIYDLSGRLVYQAPKLEFQIDVDLSNVGNGQYFAILKDASKGVSTAKFQVLK